MSKILVAMSGGVDSSTVATKLLEEGNYIEGITLDFGNFCSELGKIDAMKVAKQLNIQHHCLKCDTNLKEKVIDYFINEYFLGKTPNPCVKCNREVKFYELITFMKKNDFDYVATGHYANISNNNGIYYLEEGIDKTKDQSYFLGQLKYEYLQYIKFPLGNLKKTQVREYAKKHNLYVADKKESQDICFVSKEKNFKNFLQKYNQNYKLSSGDIILFSTGEKIGTHNGIINYTQGQRKGLGIGWTEPLFVISLDPIKNIVYVDTEEKLYKKQLTIKNINFLDLSLKENEEYIFNVKLRSTNLVNKAKIIFNSNNTADIDLFEPSRNISKGQLCAIYNQNRLIASGFIC